MNEKFKTIVKNHKLDDIQKRFEGRYNMQFRT
jgi:hypothetical protein